MLPFATQINRKIFLNTASYMLSMPFTGLNHNLRYGRIMDTIDRTIRAELADFVMNFKT